MAAAAVVAIMAIGIFGGLERRSAERLTKLFDSAETLTSRTSGRWDLALGGWHIFLEHPLGVGTGAFASAWATLRDQRGISAFQGTSKEAHSAWVKILVENGVPGILLFGAFILSFAVLGWKRRSSGLFLPGLLVTFALSVAFVADEFQGKGLWFLAGAVLLLLRGAPFQQQGVLATQRVGSRLAVPSVVSR